VKNPLFISKLTVEAMHRRSLDEHGGQDGVRDTGSLDSAIVAPIHAFQYERADVFQIAACYAFHLAQNQPFIDGNKRTAIATALLFLELNGVATSRLPDSVAYHAMIGMAEHRLDKAGLAALFRAHLSQ
jgi:death-on-curing protein